MLFVFGLFVFCVLAQDPAPGWLGYATASCPPGTKVTHMEAKWKVGANPQPSEAFFSPWFGIGMYSGVTRSLRNVRYH